LQQQKQHDHGFWWNVENKIERLQQQKQSDLKVFFLEKGNCWQDNIEQGDL